MPLVPERRRHLREAFTGNPSELTVNHGFLPNRLTIRPKSVRQRPGSISISRRGRLFFRSACGRLLAGQSLFTDF